MQTNYENLNWFDVSVVGMIAVGILVLGAVAFTNLTPRSQHNFTSAVQMFDIHEEVASTGNAINLVMDTQQAFYNQFYIAFEQVATLQNYSWQAPEELSVNFYEHLGAIQDSLTSHHAAVAVRSGRVAGIRIENNVNSYQAPQIYLIKMSLPKY